MPVQEITDKARVHALLANDPIANLEAIDENHLGVEGLVSVLASSEERPANMMIVRWGQKHLGLGSLARLSASRLSGLDDVVAALPIERGQLDVVLPFWTSAAITSAFTAEVAGAEAIYTADRAFLVPSPAAKRAERLTEPDIVKPMFPKLARDAPIYVLALKDQLTAVAAVTHLMSDVARIFVYTVEASRGHGFGRGVLSALAEELLALRIVPTLAIDLADERAVRMVESAGLRQARADLRVRVLKKREEAPPSGGGLVSLGRRP